MKKGTKDSPQSEEDNFVIKEVKTIICQWKICLFKGLKDKQSKPIVWKPTSCR